MKTFFYYYFKTEARLRFFGTNSRWKQQEKSWQHAKDETNLEWSGSFWSASRRLYFEEQNTYLTTRRRLSSGEREGGTPLEIICYEKAETFSTKLNELVQFGRNFDSKIRRDH